MTTYTWTDDVMQSGTTCDVDKVADNLMHLKYDTSSGVCKFNALGTISDDFTLTENYITTGDVSGDYDLTLPTVTDTEKQIVCVFDFTTTNASYPTITNTNLKWSDKNKGIAPSFLTLSGVRNILTFKSIWINSTLYWEAEYKTCGAVEVSFTRPNLSANGTLGGASFAVSGNTEQAVPHAFYNAVDGSSSTFSSQAASPLPYYKFYNPNALKVSALSWVCYSTEYATALTLYGSNDNSTYTAIQSYSSLTNGTVSLSIDESNRDFYKYYKIQTTAVNNYLTIYELLITATYIATI